MPRHVHNLAKAKPVKAVVQGIQEAREAKLEARRELLAHQEVLKQHTEQAHLQEEPKLNKDDKAPNLAAIDKDKTIRFNRDEDTKPEEDKTPEVDKKPEDKKQPVIEPEDENDSEIEEPETEKPLYASLGAGVPFFAAWEKTANEMVEMQLQMSEVMIGGWMKLALGQWFPPSPMND